MPVGQDPDMIYHSFLIFKKGKVAGFSFIQAAYFHTMFSLLGCIPVQ